jgi:hypothetical protein
MNLYSSDEPLPTEKPVGPPTAPHDPLNPDPSNPTPVPLPPDSNPEPRAPVREPEQPVPVSDPMPPEPTRLM